MSPRMLARVVPAFALLLQAWASLPAKAWAEPPPKKILTIEDLYLFDRPHSEALAPDGRRLVFERRWIDTHKHDRHALWIVEGSRDRARPLEKEQPDGRAPVFAPDGKWLAFLSTRPRPEAWKEVPAVPQASDPATDVWLLPADGGAALPLIGPEKPYGRVFNDGFYGHLAFSPDGRRLVFVADDGKDPRTPEEKDADVEIVRPDQGEGYTGYRPAQIWVADLEPTPGKWAARRVERLTDDDIWYGDPHWSPDGRTIVVHANKTADRESVRYSINKNFDLWAIDVETRAVRQLTAGPGPEVSPRFSPDGKRIACLSIPRKGSHMDVFNLAIVTLGPGGAHTEVVFDHHGPGGAHPPHPPPSFPLPEECWDGNGHLVYHAALGTDSDTFRVALDTARGKPFVVPAVGKEGPVSEDPLLRHLQLRRQWTPEADTFLAQRALAENRLFKWENEGRQLDGVLTVPPMVRPPYKLVVFPHGGPHSRATAGFNFTAQVFAAQGYAVFQPNFRGSAGYGQQFIDADRGDFGGGDMRDILSGVDALVTQSVADRERQFLYGVSYGGYTTCWLVGHSHQFRAAVAQNAVTDLDAMWGLSDIQSWTEWEFGGRPWEVPAAMRGHSPITYAANVQTPTLILHSRDDRRCPLPMGRMFYQALAARKVPAQMVIYPNEGHGIRQPRHQEDVLRRTLAWFAQHDKR